MTNKLKSALFFSLILLQISCSKKADLIVTNANIWTGNEQQPSAEAMVIVDDKIVAIGDKNIVNDYDDNSHVLDAKGELLVPGFIDSHVHLLTGGRSLMSVELRDARTPDEFIERIGNFAHSINPGEWILEGNWDHTLWGGALPHKEWIDSVTLDNPVVIYRLDGHMVLANSKALSIAGIDSGTSEVAGGEIIRHSDGSPTGILKNNAMHLLLGKIPPMSQSQQEQSFKAAMNYFLANGVSSVHDVDSLASYPIAQQFLERGELSIRIYQIHPLYDWAEVEASENKWLKTGGVKGFVDGSLGSHTAAFHLPYSDKKEDRGFFIFDEEELYKWISQADKKGLQIMVHAIGDRAIHTLLNIYRTVINENGQRDRRLRIEHAQHIAPSDIERFAKMGIIASVQPYHAIDDGRWAGEVIGKERSKTTYAFRSLINSGARIAFGSDWAVAPASPVLGIYAAVTRRTLDDQNPDGWIPLQKISVESALKAYTVDAAYASFQEESKGSLEIGKLADFVILSEDITKIEKERIKDVKVLQTYVGGKEVFNIEK